MNTNPQDRPDAMTEVLDRLYLLEKKGSAKFINDLALASTLLWGVQTSSSYLEAVKLAYAKVNNRVVETETDVLAKQAALKQLDELINILKTDLKIS